MIVTSTNTPVATLRCCAESWGGLWRFAWTISQKVTAMKQQSMQAKIEKYTCRIFFVSSIRSGDNQLVRLGMLIICGGNLVITTGSKVIELGMSTMMTRNRLVNWSRGMVASGVPDKSKCDATTGGKFCAAPHTNATHATLKNAYTKTSALALFIGSLTHKQIECWEGLLILVSLVFQKWFCEG